MKTTVWMILCMAFLGAQLCAEAAYRNFTSTDGQSLNARVLEYDSKSKRVQLEREDGKRSWVKAAIFSKEDQVYLEKWEQASGFLSDAFFPIRIKDFDEESNKYKESCWYEVELENRMNRTLENVRIEYFILIQRKDLKVKSVEDRVSSGTIEFEPIYPRTKVFGETKKAALFVQCERDLGRGDVPISKDDLIGVWFRIYGPSVDGEVLVRDVCEPKDLQKKYKWNAGGTLVPCSE